MILNQDKGEENEMKYIVKCPYCGNTYTIELRDNGTLLCPSCGAQNTMQNVINKVMDQQPQQPQYQYSNLYHMQNQQNVPHVQPRKNTRMPGLIVAIVISVLLLSSCIIVPVIEAFVEMGSDFSAAADHAKEQLNWEENAEVKLILDNTNEYIESIKNNDAEQLSKSVYLPEGSYVTEKEVITSVRAGDMGLYLGNENTQIKRIDFISNEDTVKKYKITMDDDGYYYIKYRYEDMSKQWKPVLENNVIYDKTVKAPTDCTIYIDDNQVTLDAEKYTDDNGFEYNIYTIPVMSTRDYKFSIDTACGKLSEIYECNWNDEIPYIQLSNNAKLVQSYKDGIEDIWKNLFRIGEEGGKASDARQYFDDQVSDEEIEEALKGLRKLMSDGKIVEVDSFSIYTVSDIYANSNDVYSAKMAYTYDWSNGNGQYNRNVNFGNLLMTYKDGKWLIYSTFDNSMFNDAN